jgi:hypothetical protein
MLVLRPLDVVHPFHKKKSSANSLPKHHHHNNKKKKKAKAHLFLFPTP